jgi:deazaflavin-dependent oxidoreductase (nitroreductase family)
MSGRTPLNPMTTDDDTGPARAKILSVGQRFWRNRTFARIRHRATWMRRLSARLTRVHAALVRLSGGRIQRSFVFTGGMPILVLTTVGRKSGKSRSTPVGYLRHDDGFAVLASNAGNDRSPAWWLNLQANPHGEVLAERTRHTVKARRATPTEEASLWAEFARLNPGFDEYRSLTDRQIPVVVLEPIAAGTDHDDCDESNAVDRRDQRPARESIIGACPAAKPGSPFTRDQAT